MAEATFTSATIDASGLVLTVVQALPKGSTWIVPFAEKPESLTVGNVAPFVTATLADGDMKVEEAVFTYPYALSRTIRASERPTISAPAGDAVDADGNSTAEMDAEAAVNNSTVSRMGARMRGRARAR